MKCMSELISCLGKNILNKKKRAKTNSHSETSQWVSWYSRVASAAGTEGRRQRGGRQRAVGDEVRRVAYQPSTTVRVLDFIPVWEIMGAIGERTDMV